MVTDKHIRTWVSLQGLPIITLSNGIKSGSVEDFYLDAESNEVRALQVNYGVLGIRALPNDFITEIRPDAVAVPNPQALVDPRRDGRLPALILGSSLRSYKLMSEKGRLIGPVADVVLDTYPPNALRVTGFVVSGSREIVPANAATSYDKDIIYILDNVAKSFL